MQSRNLFMLSNRIRPFHVLPCDPKGKLKSFITGRRQDEQPIGNGKRGLGALERIAGSRDHVIIANAELKTLSPALQSRGGGELQPGLSRKTEYRDVKVGRWKCPVRQYCRP